MLLIFTKMLTIALMLALGVLVYRLDIVTPAGNKEISSLIVTICSPVMVVSSALADESRFSLGKLGLVLLVAVGMHLVFVLFGRIVPPLLGINREEQPFFSMLSVFGNTGFIGIPLALSILGPSSMLYVIVVNICYNLFFYSYGYYEMGKASGRAAVFQPKKLLNPGILSCFVALALYLLPLELPAVLSDTMGYVSGCTTFLSMLVLGVNLAAMPLKKVLAVPRVWLFGGLRILVLPILLALGLRLFLTDHMMVSALTLMAAMPAGSMSVMLATDQGCETDTLTSGIIITTLMCLVTVPLVSFFFPL